MTIRCHRTHEELLALAPRWNELLQRSSSNAIFLTWEWVSTWWAVFGRRFQLLLLTAEDENGQLIGIAPTMVGRRRSASGLTFRVLMFIGQRGDTLAEYLDFIIQPGHEAEITAAFCDFMQRDLAAEWDCIFLERILTTSPNLPTLERKTSCPRFTALRDRELRSPHAALGCTWAEFLAAKSRNFRNQWNNSWNRLQAAGDVQFLFGGNDVPLSTALTEVTRLHRERWEGRSASFSTEDYLDFHKQLSARFHANGWLLLLLLSVNGKNVAARYDYIYAGKLWCMQGGWSPDHAAQRVGTLLTGKVIQWGIEHGLREYDFLGKASDYKRRWSDGERVMINLIACNPRTFRGWVWKWNRVLEGLARRAKKRLRTKRMQPPQGTPSSSRRPLTAPTRPFFVSSSVPTPLPHGRCPPPPGSRHQARIGT